MTDAVPAPPQEVSYPISYQVFAGNTYNHDFTGKGILTIRAARPSYIFQGKQRALFSRRWTELEFGPDDIWNVMVNDRGISFHTNLGKGGPKHLPFSFYCTDAKSARELAALLPSRQDQDFTATRAFSERLKSLSGASSPWTSVTNVIIALNVLVFLIMGCLGAGWFEVESMEPYLLFGANNGAATTDGEWWRLLTSMFVHYGLIHLACNMWALYQAGHFLEKLQGRRLYALTYLGSGLAGGLLSIAWHGDKIWSAGASGAIFGVYGAIMGYMLRERQGLPAGVYKPMMKSTLTFAAYNIFYGLKAGVDNSAHVGGIVAGLILGWLLALPVDGEVRRQATKGKVRLGLLAIAIIVAAGVLLTPRFDYNVRDEINWGKTNQEFGAKEADLIKQQEQGVAGLEKGGNGPVHANWMARELVPFYERWDHDITALQLSPGRRTARMRDQLDRIFQMRLQSYQHLISGLRANSPDALNQYHAAEYEVEQEILNFVKANKP